MFHSSLNFYIAIFLLNTVKVTAKKAGKKVSKTLKATVTVKNPSLTLKAASEVAVGATEQITATVKPANTKVTYTSSDKEIATVDAKGVVTGVKAGDVTITVKAGKTTKTVKMTVVAKLAAKQTGAKKVTVSFGKAPADTSAVKIAVKKGNTTLAQKAVAFTDAKTAVVELNQSLTAGAYTVEVTGVEETAMTADFTVDSEEYIATIELTSDKAPMGNTDGTQIGGVAGNKIATVGYVLKNQYGEIVNSNANAITWTVSTGVAVGNTDYSYKNGAGTLTIQTSAAAFIPGNEVFVNAVLTNGTHVATLSSKVQIVLPASFDKAEIAGVYNKTLKKMDTVSSAKLTAAKNPYVYELLFTAKDQYGNNMDADKVAAGSFFTALSTNPIFIQTTSTFETVDIDGKTYVAMKLAAGTMASKGGNATIQIISSSTGTKSTYDIVADAAGAVDKFTLGNPTEYAVAGEKLEIPFTALDQYGNAVTAYDALAGKVNLQANGAGLSFVKKTDGTAKLVLDLTLVAVPANSDLPVYMTSVVAANGNYSSASVNVKNTAVPKSIGGIKASSKKATTLALPGGNVELTYKDLDVLDQYGRVMSNDAVKTWLSTATNKIVVKQADATSASAVKVYQDAGTTDSASANLTDATTSKVVITAQADGNEKVEFSLVTAAGTVAGSEKNVTFSTSTQKEYTSYAVDDLGTLYFKTDAAQTTHKVAPAVYGVKADGSKVKLLPSYYDITTNAKENALEVDATKGEISEKTNTVYGDSDFKKADGSYQDVTVKVTIQIKNADGSFADTITKDLKLSNKAPAVTTVKFTSAVSDGKASVKFSDVTASGLQALLDANEIKDQYGVKVADAADDAKIAISNVEAAADNFAITNNGTATVSFAHVTVNDTFTVTFTVGGVSVKTDVIVVND